MGHHDVSRKKQLLPDGRGFRWVVDKRPGIGAGRVRDKRTNCPGTEARGFVGSGVAPRQASPFTARVDRSAWLFSCKPLEKQPEDCTRAAIVKSICSESPEPRSHTLGRFGHSVPPGQVGSFRSHPRGTRLAPQTRADPLYRQHPPSSLPVGYRSLCGRPRAQHPKEYQVLKFGLGSIHGPASRYI